MSRAPRADEPQPTGAPDTVRDSAEAPSFVHVADLVLHLFVSTDRIPHDQGLMLLKELSGSCAADILTEEAARAAAWIPAEPKFRTLEQRGVMKVVDALRARARAIAPRTPHVTTITPKQDPKPHN